MAPQPEVVDIFRLKYDYHNIKTLVKAAGANVSGDRLLSGNGRVAPEKLKAAVEEDPAQVITIISAGTAI